MKKRCSCVVCIGREDQRQLKQVSIDLDQSHYSLSWNEYTMNDIVLASALITCQLLHANCSKCCTVKENNQNCFEPNWVILCWIHIAGTIATSIQFSLMLKSTFTSYNLQVEPHIFNFLKNVGLVTTNKVWENFQLNLS